MTSDLPLPHNLEAERAVLGAALLDPAALHEAMAVLRPTSFYRQAHQRIYEALLAVQARGVSPDFIVLREELTRLGQIDEVGGPAYVASLVDGLPVVSHVRQHAEIVREKARLREAIVAANRLVADALDGGTSDEVLDRGLRDLSLLAEPTSRGPVTELGAIRDYVAGLSAGTHGVPVMSGFTDLDALLGGFRLGDLVVVAARPSTGKSSMALGVAQHAAAVGRPSAFFSLEMGMRALAARLLAWRTRIPTDRLERGQATLDEYARVSDVVTDGAESPLRIETAVRTVSEMTGWCRRLKQEHGLALVVVDYLQLLAPPERSRDSREVEVAGITAALKRLAVDEDVVVVALSQLSRAPEARRDKRPHLADLRESGAIEQVTDVALLLFREEMHRPKPENAGVAEVIVAKNRNGPVGVVRLAWRRELAMFADLEREGGCRV